MIAHFGTIQIDSEHALIHLKRYLHINIDRLQELPKHSLNDQNTKYHFALILLLLFVILLVVRVRLLVLLPFIDMKPVGHDLGARLP